MFRAKQSNSANLSVPNIPYPSTGGAWQVTGAAKVRPTIVTDHHKPESCLGKFGRCCMLYTRTFLPATWKMSPDSPTFHDKHRGRRKAFHHLHCRRLSLSHDRGLLCSISIGESRVSLTECHHVPTFSRLLRVWLILLLYDLSVSSHRCK